MGRLARTAAALLALLVLGLALTVGSADARRRVPPLFVGASFDGPMLAAPDSLQAQQYPKMAAAGIETMRVAFVWARLQPHQADPIDLSSTDRIVARAAANRIQVMPHVITAPIDNRWDLSHQPFAPPSDPRQLGPLMSALIARYGPQGTFWSDHPQLPRLPIRTWQFWNEPHLQYQWAIPKSVSWSASYAWELKYFYAAVKQADPGAKVVLAGLTNRSWVYLQRLYDDGIKGHFDVAAIHPYTQKPAGTVELVRRFRAVMSRHGDGGKPVWATELGLPASRGRSRSKNSLQTTDRGMASFLEQAFRALAHARRSPATRVSRVYWYTWGSEYRGDIFRYTGLFRYAGHGKPQARPAYAAFVRTARWLEGCARTAARVCG